MPSRNSLFGIYAYLISNNNPWFRAATVKRFTTTIAGLNQSVSVQGQNPEKTRHSTGSRFTTVAEMVSIRLYTRCSAWRSIRRSGRIGGNGQEVIMSRDRREDTASTVRPSVRLAPFPALSNPMPEPAREAGVFGLKSRPRRKDRSSWP